MRFSALPHTNPCIPSHVPARLCTLKALLRKPLSHRCRHPQYTQLACRSQEEIISKTGKYTNATPAAWKSERPAQRGRPPSPSGASQSRSGTTPGSGRRTPHRTDILPLPRYLRKSLCRQQLLADPEFLLRLSGSLRLFTHSLLMPLILPLAHSTQFLRPDTHTIILHRHSQPGAWA